MKKGLLLVNLGSPDSTDPNDVKRYLGEFLMDERVIDLDYWKRALLVKGIILNTRPKKSAAAYKKVWTSEGSPLIVISERLTKKVRERLGSETPVALGMRYGNPSIKSALEELRMKGVDQLFVIPLYPQYAMSTTETVEEKVKEDLQAMEWKVERTFQPPFYNDRNYLKALTSSIAEQIDQNEYDKVLFSYHGIPERHIFKTDRTGLCKIDGSCCNTPSEAHKRCYRHQCLQTTKNVISLLNWSDDKVLTTFQSRLGRAEWLKPYTANTLEELPRKGIKKIAVITPAFVADCLETIEEIGMEGKEEFLHAGGEKYDVVPCLNDRDDFAETIVTWFNGVDS
ncbi:ferrochelatase [Parvicella tangerina]|uniref:Ferrochelatase n=1 Tax=Parvicella tangerina TaxID=2829795 RepID=A0A916JPL8_9FLAO|nr:ferrochelatase [Parvicella tangerina]CAG5083183.1 Ferrochelatase [Parvicella tangerina]